MTKPFTALLIPTDGAADLPTPQPTVTQQADGTIVVSVTVPAGTPDGIYVMAIMGTDAAGRPRVLIIPVVVRSSARPEAPSRSAGGEVAAVVPERRRPPR